MASERTCYRVAEHENEEGAADSDLAEAPRSCSFDGRKRMSQRCGVAEAKGGTISPIFMLRERDRRRGSRTSKTAWETAVLKAHGVKVERTRGKLSAENRAKLAEIDLNFHDLRHEAGSSEVEGGWPLHASPRGSVITKLETTAKYLNVTTQYCTNSTSAAVNARPRVTANPPDVCRLKPADDGGFNCSSSRRVSVGTATA
jgi:hypothetical protein